jgi:hypothetical protein
MSTRPKTLSSGSARSTPTMRRGTPFTMTMALMAAPNRPVPPAKGVVTTATRPRAGDPVLRRRLRPSTGTPRT